MRRTIALLFIAFGLVIMGLASYELIQTKDTQNEALEEAKTIISNLDKDENQNEIPSEAGQSENVREKLQPQIGDVIGLLSIPRLGKELPIIEGTNEDELAIGVGHFSKTAFPTEGKQILLSGHRDTVFRRLGELEIGDIFEVKMSYGTYLYKIEETFIVGANDKTVIDYSIDEEILTLSTCYPFSFVGSAPDRYIINAKPVD